MTHISVVLLILAGFFGSHGTDEPCETVRLFEKAPFPVGTALNVEKLKFEERYWTTALAQYNSFTPEKIMKPRFIHPSSSEFYFFETDRLMEFCTQNKIRLHGHALLWHDELPKWMEKFKGDRGEWDKMMKDHVQGIVAHCRSSVHSWDVVNEGFNDDGTFRKSIWLENLGPEYIENAFRYAAEADPGALLFYNDFGLEHDGVKLQAVLAHLSQLKRKGVKVDGIGLQMHVSPGRPSAEEVTAVARRIEAAGFLVHFSEMDISLAGYSLFTSSGKLLELQANYLRQIIKGYLTLKPEARFGITMWGVSDNDSWLTEQHFRARPLLLDRRYRVKPAYCGFLEALTASR